MDAIQLDILIKDITKQLKLRNYVIENILKFDLCQTKDSKTDEMKVYIEVNSSGDVLYILDHYKLSLNFTESDIEILVKEKKLNTTEGICLILEIQ